MSKLFFEAKGEEILRNKGIKKTEFARSMGIRKQNVKSLFKTKNIDTIWKAGKVLDIPLVNLIAYVEEPVLDDICYDKNPFVQMAFDFIDAHDLGKMPAGTHVIDGENLWVNIVDTDLKTRKKARLEAHAKYIDVQVPLSRKESFGIKPVADCTSPVGKMDTEKDILFYDDPIEKVVTVEPGTPIIFGPDTAHAPLIGRGRIRKAIFKAKVSGEAQDGEDFGVRRAGIEFF